MIFTDVLGAGKGWAASLMCRESICIQLDVFRKRSDTFSLGVCNGCQLMAHLGWLDPPSPRSGSTDSDRPAVALEHNASGRYESRFVTVRIDATDAVLLRGMAGSRFGVWVAHEQGCVGVELPSSGLLVQDIAKFR